MSESESPKRGKKKGEGKAPETDASGEGPVEAGPAPNEPAGNPWRSAGDDPAQRRSASIDDIFRSRRPSSSRLPGVNGKAMWSLAAAGVLSAWLATTSLHILSPGEQGLVTTFGRFEQAIGPGLNVTMPWPVQAVVTRKVAEENKLLLPEQESETLMLTRDGELIDLRSQVGWKVKDLKQFTFALPDGEKALRRLADSAIRAGVAELTFDELRGGKRQAELQQRIAGRLQRVLDAWNAGITIVSVEVTGTKPPAKLAEAYKKIDKANETARKNHEAAVTYASRIRTQADLEAASFDKAYELYKIDPRVTRERIYYDTVERVLRNNPVVIGGPVPASAPPAIPAAKQEGN
ncbi:MAG: protease modulator HflK [Novosphingobium sp.]